MKHLTTIVLSFLLAIIASSAALALPATIHEVAIDDIVLQPASQGSNRLSILRGEDASLRIVLRATDDIRNAKVRAIITDTDEIEAESDSFDIDVASSPVTRVVKLTLSLPNDLETGRYKLRIFVSDRNSIEIRENYDLLIDALRHDTAIEELIINPGTVLAGEVVKLSAWVKNAGSRDEKDIRIDFRLPELDLGGKLYLDDLDADSEDQPEEPLELRIPCSVKPGRYALEASLEYDKGRREDSATGSLTVVENPACTPKLTTIIVQQPPAAPAPVAPAPAPKATVSPVTGATTLRGSVELVVLGLIGVFIIIGVLVGLSRLRNG